jgi:CheY-like chemotaxis protein
MLLLLVEDDSLLGEGLQIGLTQLGYAVDWLRDGVAARHALEREQFDLVVLDVGFPGVPHREIQGLELFDKVVDINQSPIGPTPRSNPATYTGLFTTIRDLFAATQEARARNYSVGRFSFNVKGDATRPAPATA